jgi:hypothetical protein
VGIPGLVAYGIRMKNNISGPDNTGSLYASSCQSLTLFRSVLMEIEEGMAGGNLQAKFILYINDLF